MKTALLLGMALLVAAPAVRAQQIVNAPRLGAPMVRVDADDYYWRRGHEQAEWRRREEWRDREWRREAWRRDHCVRDYYGRVWCR